jgi:hypothetical protein
MRKYFVAKDEAERDAALEKLRLLGYAWTNGYEIGGDWKPSMLIISYESNRDGLTQGECGKQTTIERFLIDLEIETLKQRKRLLPKL